MSDTSQQVNDLMAVLREYDVIVEDIQRHNVVSFWLHNKRVVYPYSSTTSQAELRQKLIELGARAKMDNSATHETPQEQLAEQPAEQPIAQPAEQPIAQPAEQPTPPPPEMAPVLLAQKLEHNAMTYQSSQVIGIQINETITIEAGHVLVIPMHRPTALTTMRKEQFHILFPEMAPPPSPNIVPQRRARAPETPEITMFQEESYQEPYEEPYQERRVVRPRPAPPEPKSVRPDPMNTAILNYLKQRKHGMRIKEIAGALNYAVKSVEERLQYMRDLGDVIQDKDAWSLKPATLPAPQPKPPTKPPARNVPPQVGRILFAMAYAEQTSGSRDLAAAQVTVHLSNRDKKQYGARLPEAVKQGWVARGRPLGHARGWHYQLTNKAREIIKGLGAAPYEGERVPDWVASLA